MTISIPCNIGDIVYRINEGSINNPIIPMRVTEVVIKSTVLNAFNSIKCKGMIYGGELEYKFNDIGKTVFLTEEAARQKIKDMEDE